MTGKFAGTRIQGPSMCVDAGESSTCVDIANVLVLELPIIKV